MAQRRRVVYIEDNVANFALVRKVLEHSGNYEVLGATSGEEGLELVAKVDPALVLLDLDLPGIDGFAVAERLAADPRTCNLPVIAISASVMKHERERALEAGCVNFVEKPFDIVQLRAIVAATIEGADEL